MAFPDDLKRYYTAKIHVYTRNRRVTVEIPTNETELTSSVIRHSLELRNE